MVNEIKRKRNNTSNSGNADWEESHQGLVSLPWIPGLSPKLRKEFKKAGYKVVFKSGRNLNAILTSKNKTQLPENSYPGVYKVSCEKHPNNPYLGETKLQIHTRIEQHQAYVRKEQWEKSGAASHSRTCDGLLWNKTETVKIEKNRFDRRVREALEIQYNKCGPNTGGMNLDIGQYVKTQFWTPFFRYLRTNRGRELTSNNETNAAHRNNTMALSD